MHELSLMATVIETIEKYAKENDARDIESLTLQVGEISSVVPEYLKSCFPIAAKGTILEAAELIIEPVPMRARCLACGNEFIPDAETKEACPSCGGKALKIVSGREFFIKEIAVAD